MNLREGTRRLALLLGVVGAIAGGFISYLELQTVLDRQVRHNRFEQLANSDVVKQEREIRRVAKNWLDANLQRSFPVPENQTVRDLGNRTVVKEVTIKHVLDDPQFYGLPPTEQNKALSMLVPNFAKLSAQEQEMVIADAGMPSFARLTPEVNKGGIKTIEWGEGFSVGSIQTDNGQTVYPTPAPSAWLYLWVALFPLFGFFIPWGAIRVIGWVGAGFVASPK